jgi:hypothetical protein
MTNIDFSGSAAKIPSVSLTDRVHSRPLMVTIPCLNNLCPRMEGCERPKRNVFHFAIGLRRKAGGGGEIL